MAAKAYLVTHPETELDKQGRVHGKLDPPLSYSGRIKAQQIARGFKGKSVQRIHSSPRIRAKELAEMIAKETGAPVHIHAELEPWDLSNLSGSKVASIRPLLDFFSSRPFRPVPGGESKSQVLARYKSFMAKLKAGDVIVGHSQHSLALEHVRKGGDAAKVPMFGGKAGEVREVKL
jgi:broad specificity phosphatase PhoE